MRLRAETLMSLGFVIFFTGEVYLARGWPIQAKLFPWTIGIPGLILSLVQLWRDLTGWTVSNRASSSGSQVDEVYQRTVPLNVEIARTLRFFGWMIATALAVWLLGFALALPLFVFAYTKADAREGWLFSLGMTAGTVALLTGLFEYYLGMRWAPGVLTGWTPFS